MPGESTTVTLSSGYKMPMVGYGTYTMEDDDVVKAILEAIECGYRLIDTATYYKNEAGIGKAVSEAIKKNLVKREELFITTKIWPTHYSKNGVNLSVKKSLEDLGEDVKYLDLVLLHWPSIKGALDSPEEAGAKREVAWTALENLVSEGLIRSIGVSNFLPKHLVPLICSRRADGKERIMPAVNQIELHLLCYCLSLAAIHCCEKYKIVIQAYSPLARGYLFKVDDKFVQKLTSLAKPSGLSYSQVLLKFLLQKGHCVVVKSASTQRLKENFGIVSANNLDEDAVEEINKIVCNPEQLKLYGVAPCKKVWDPTEMN